MWYSMHYPLELTSRKNHVHHITTQSKTTLTFWDNSVLYGPLQHHNDIIIKTQEEFFRKIFTSQFICNDWKGYSRFACERELETERNSNILTPFLMAVNVVSFSFSRAAQVEAQRPTLLGDGFLYCILSATSLVPKLHRGSRGPLRPGVAFPTTSRL